jgi:hypothetical protein
MQFIPWIVAAVALVAAGILIWQWLKAGRELGLMRSTDTSKASDVPGKPPGTLVELKGTLRSHAPLKGEFSGSECVYYGNNERHTVGPSGRPQRRRHATIGRAWLL